MKLFSNTELVLRHWLIMAVSTLVVVSTLMAVSTLQMLLLLYNCTMRSLETTSGDLETTSQFGTWKWMRESFQGLQQLLEVAVTVGSYGDCWKLRWLLEAAAGCWRGPQYDGKCSFYFNCYFFRTTPTNRDLRQKAVYFPSRVTATVTSLQRLRNNISNLVHC